MWSPYKPPTGGGLQGSVTQGGYLTGAGLGGTTPSSGLYKGQNYRLPPMSPFGLSPYQKTLYGFSNPPPPPTNNPSGYFAFSGTEWYPTEASPGGGASSGYGGGGGGDTYSSGPDFGSVPQPPDQRLTGSIKDLTDDYLPEWLIQHGVNQKTALLNQLADPQQYVEMSAANQGNMASAASPQNFPRIGAIIQEPLQEAAGIQAMAPAEADLQRYGFETTSLGDRHRELLGLADIALGDYSSRLQDYLADVRNKATLANLLS